MPTLRQTLNGLAASFAAEVLEAIRGASLEDLVAQHSAGGRRAAARAPVANGGAARTAEVASAPRAARGRGGRLARRSSGDIAGVIQRIVGIVQQSPKGLRAEQIRQKLGLEAKELPRPLREALEAGKLAKSGEKRATTYFIKGAAIAAAPAPGRGRAKAAGGKPAAARKAKRAGKPARRAKRK
jgi:hypothetical protein